MFELKRENACVSIGNREFTPHSTNSDTLLLLAMLFSMSCATLIERLFNGQFTNNNSPASSVDGPENAARIRCPHNGRRRLQRLTLAQCSRSGGKRTVNASLLVRSGRWGRGGGPMKGRFVRSGARAARRRRIATGRPAQRERTRRFGCFGGFGRKCAGEQLPRGARPDVSGVCRFFGVCWCAGSGRSGCCGCGGSGGPDRDESG